ncbi:MAG: HXXEE domain-containing protein, partial [Steroidobacteraceae bacterium]
MLHVLEEAPDFVAWFNSHVEPDITERLFLTVNMAALLITLLVTAFAVTARGRATALMVTAWVGFLMLANGLLHVTAAIVDRAYAPGVVTSLL